jgi:hypothetical protein
MKIESTGPDRLKSILKEGDYIMLNHDDDNDAVNHPPHYNNGKIECIEAIEAMLTHEEFVGYLRGNSLKYRWRFRYKNGVQDLDKATWYENKLKQILLNKEEDGTN